jgi:hypothetical protein
VKPTAPDTIHAGFLGLMMGLTLMSASVGAEETTEYTASEVASWCQPYRSALLVNGTATVQQSALGQFCFGSFFTLAAMTAIPGGDGADKPPALGICAPENSRTSDFIKIFLHYTDEHPEQGPESFLVVAITALQKTYPCIAKSSKH